MTEITFAEPRDWALTVLDVVDLTTSMRRVRVGSEELHTLEHFPGQDMAVTFPSEGDATVRRRYTIRAFDRHKGTVDLDFVLHGDGPAARWAATAEPGMPLHAIGPRGKITVEPQVDWHLFAGDDAAVPGVSAMVESLPPGSTARVVLEVDCDGDELPLAAADGVDVDVTWLHREGAAAGTSNLLLEQIGALEVPDAARHGYLAGEYSVVQALRRLLTERGMTKEELSPKPYWRLGRRNMPHGEPERD